jgi:plastocyanin
MLNLRKEIFPTRRGIVHGLLAFTFWFILLPVHSGLAYEEISNFTGGHLKGIISIKGTLVSPRRFNLVLYADPYYCGRISDGEGWRFSPITRPGPNRSLPGAIVYLEDIQQGKPIPSTPRVVQTKDCVFLPYISSTKAGEGFRFQNWDPVEHKLEIFLTSSTGGLRLFGQDLPPHPDNRKSDFLSEGTTGTHRGGPEVAYVMDKPGIVVFRCTYHEYMEGWSVVLSHPYVTMAGDRGEFSITDIPPGTYNLTVWHPMGHTSTTIHILPQHTLNLDMDIPLSSSTIYPEDHPAPNPYGIELVGDSHIAPTVELQQWDVPSNAVK